MSQSRPFTAEGGPPTAIAGAVQGTTLISLRAASYYTPQRLAVGAAFDLLPSLTVHAELAWLNWAAFEGGVPDLRIAIALGVTPAMVQLAFPPDRFRDVFVPRSREYDLCDPP